MSRRLNRASYTRLCMEVLVHRYMYYCLHRPLISDFLYDELERTLIEFEKLKPKLIHPDSPTLTVSSDDPFDYPRSVCNVGTKYDLRPSAAWEFQVDVWQKNWLPDLQIAKKTKIKRAS